MGFISSGGSIRSQTWLKYMDSFSDIITICQISASLSWIALLWLQESISCLLGTLSKNSTKNMYLSGYRITLPLRRDTLCDCVPFITWYAGSKSDFGSLSALVSTIIPPRLGSEISYAYNISSCTMGIEEFFVDISFLSSSITTVLLSLWSII